MEDNYKEKYFNFPIQLVEGFMEDSKLVLNNISDYGIYLMSLNYEFGEEEEERMASAFKFFNLEKKNVWKTHERGKNLYDSLEMKSPMVGIKMEIFWDYYKNPKTDFQKATLLAHLAIRSILKDKSYCKITNLYLWSRMDGKTHAVDDKWELSPSIRKFTNHYQTRKLKNELKDNWFLIEYSRRTRGWFVSYKMSLTDLIFYVEKRKKKNRDEKRKQDEKEAYDQAMRRLKNDYDF
ncbi:hypothetical protein PXD56_13710 [Maribacter sp. SA7]|uniref:hypothetical protein n=1 Tax=Maribacter zhoushanensis TaxID=3030012 RepID=UPI0023ECB4EB|nr:hypothetical protein [Maribacter zhoushanensis]MDF4204024.1 hypothetical protein [Maribacter zhoushanensis]